MTKGELYNKIKNGAVYGHEASYGTHETIYLGEGRDGRDYIFFNSYGKWASEVRYKDFCDSFAVHWKSANEFLKSNYELYNIYD